MLKWVNNAGQCTMKLRYITHVSAQRSSGAQRRSMHNTCKEQSTEHGEVLHTTKHSTEHERLGFVRNEAQNVQLGSAGLTYGVKYLPAERRQVPRD